MVRMYLLAALVLSAFTQTQAEPTDTVKYLMREPATMFDLGMLRMREFNRIHWSPEIFEFAETAGFRGKDPGIGNVVYNWDENRINIGAYFVGSASEKNCTMLLHKFVEVIAPSRSPDNDYWKTSLAGFFGHINFSDPTYPNDWEHELAQLFEATVGIQTVESTRDNPFPKVPTIYCTLRLADMASAVRSVKYNFSE